MPGPPEVAPNLLIIRRRYLGDIILLASLIRNLRLHWPSARLTLLCDQAYADAAGLHPDLDAILHYPRDARHWPAFLGRLRQTRFSHVLDIDNRDKSALCSWISGSPIRVTYRRDHPRFPLRHRWVYSDIVPLSRAWHDSHHITEIYHALLAPIGVPVTVSDGSIPVRPGDVTATRSLLEIGRGPTIAVHPGSRSRHRLWPVERFAAVCDWIHHELGARVVMVGGPGERAVIDDICRRTAARPKIIDRSLSVPELAALLSQVDLLLGHDSGPMHVAAAVGTRVVGLYGSQNAAIWRPVGKGHRVLQAPLPCPCFPPGTLPEPCRRDDAYLTYCVRQIEVDAVVAAIAESLRTSA